MEPLSAIKHSPLSYWTSVSALSALLKFWDSFLESLVFLSATITGAIKFAFLLQSYEFWSISCTICDIWVFSNKLLQNMPVVLCYTFWGHNKGATACYFLKGVTQISEKQQNRNKKMSSKNPTSFSLESQTDFLCFIISPQSKPRMHWNCKPQTFVLPLYHSAASKYTQTNLFFSVKEKTKSF